MVFFYAFLRTFAAVLKTFLSVDFRTIVDIPQPPFLIEPLEEILFVGSCFADNIGRRFAEEHFPVTVNPFGTMYNPASVLHTIERCDAAPRCL